MPRAPPPSARVFSGRRRPRGRGRRERVRRTARGASQILRISTDDESIPLSRTENRSQAKCYKRDIRKRVYVSRSRDAAGTRNVNKNHFFGAPPIGSPP